MISFLYNYIGSVKVVREGAAVGRAKESSHSGESAGREIFRPIEARERGYSGAMASERNEERADKSPNGAEDARPLPSDSLKIITGSDRLEVHVKQRELLGRNDFFQNRCDALQIAMLDFF